MATAVPLLASARSWSDWHSRAGAVRMRASHPGKDLSQRAGEWFHAARIRNDRPAVQISAKERDVSGSSLSQTEEIRGKQASPPLQCVEDRVCLSDGQRRHDGCGATIVA